eukprot:scaffold13742_cov40-Tisochrysis_lutea.AAC.2
MALLLCASGRHKERSRPLELAGGGCCNMAAVQGVEEGVARGGCHLLTAHSVSSYAARSPCSQACRLRAERLKHVCIQQIPLISYAGM